MKKHIHIQMDMLFLLIVVINYGTISKTVPWLISVTLEEP
jgi:hypothetical protein